MKLFLIRHGESTGDLDDRLGGAYNDYLTDEGTRQAQALAKQLAGRGIEAVYASPLLRARGTAAILAQALGVPHHEGADLRERNAYGILSGLTKAEAQKEYPDQVNLLPDYHLNPIGGEPYEAFMPRFLTALNELTAKNDATIAVVAHGGPISMFYREVLARGEVSCGDCSYTELDYSDSQYQFIDSTGITAKK